MHASGFGGFIATSMITMNRSDLPEAQRAKDDLRTKEPGVSLGETCARSVCEQTTWHIFAAFSLVKCLERWILMELLLWTFGSFV